MIRSINLLRDPGEIRIDPTIALILLAIVSPKSAEVTIGSSERIVRSNETF